MKPKTKTTETAIGVSQSRGMQYNWRMGGRFAPYPDTAPALHFLQCFGMRQEFL